MRPGITAIVTPSRHALTADSQGQSGSQERGMSQHGTGRGDRGSLTLMLAVLFVALIALAGVVVDGGAKLTAAENAAAIAQEAARAGAGQVDQATAHENGSFVVDENQAITAADNYLSQAGASVSGQAVPGPNGADEIVVSVTVTEPTRVLSIIGIDTMQAHGTAVANLVSGVTGPGQ
jgi:Flp pilus assembly protein TadG